MNWKESLSLHAHGRSNSAWFCTQAFADRETVFKFSFRAERVPFLSSPGAVLTFASRWSLATGIVKGED
jgi:hypothetical protein